MKNFNLFLLINLLFVFYSCNEDDLQSIADSANSENIDLGKINVVDGRLYFPNLETFQAYYYDVKEKGEYEVADILGSEFYNKGFYSLVPILNERTEGLYGEKHLDNILDKSQTIYGKVAAPTTEDILDHFDDLEEIVGEDVFESFLNSEAEIQVGNKIYKYTDQGLLIAPVQHYHKIQVFMVENNIHSLGDVNNIEPLEGELDYNPNGGLVQIEEGLEHYISEGYNRMAGGGTAPISTDPGEGGGSNGGSGNGGNNGNSGGSSGGNGSGGGNGGGSGGSGGGGQENYAQISNSLSVCSPSSPWFGNLFGTVKLCTDKYNSDHRVKTKYYSVNLFLAYAIGIKVKHQKKGWTGIWRKQNTDKVVLGVNSLSWRFDHSADFSNFGSPADVAVRYYTSDGKLYSKLGNHNPIYIGNSEIPILPFKNKVDVLVEIAIDNRLIQTEEQARIFFYSSLWDGVKNFMQSQYNKDLKKAGVVIVTPTSTWTQFYDLSTDCTNCDKKERIIDWGVATPKVTYHFGPGSGGGSFSFSYEMDFRNPSLVGMSAFGMAKRSGQWHGNRFKF